MINTYQFLTELNGNEFHHIIHATDIETSLVKWIDELRRLQGYVYSFDKETVDAIIAQNLKSEVTGNQNYISYFIKNKPIVTYISLVNKKLPDFIAEIYFLKPSEGGRKGYAASGYRPAFKIQEKDNMTCAELLFIENDIVNPGESINAEIRLLSPEFYFGDLKIGKEFQLREGPNIIAKGIITEILNESLI